MGLQEDFTILGIVTMQLPDGDDVEAFGVYERDTAGNVSICIGVTATQKAVFFDAEIGCLRLYSLHDRPYDDMVTSIIQVMTQTEGARGAVPSEFVRALGMQ